MLDRERVSDCMPLLSDDGLVGNMTMNSWTTP